MRELSLFTGGAGGVLGSILLGWRQIGYVEINKYCQQLIAQRIRDGILPSAPIFTDVREFLQSGAAREYRGFADVVTAGFPCQPFSNAGRRKGAADDRNLWPETIAVIRDVRPRYCLLENVRGLLSSGYLSQVLQDLAESGYDARWRVLSAAEVGAPHRRDRLWIVGADTCSSRRRSPAQPGQPHVGGEDAAPEGWEQGAVGLADLCAPVADAQGERAWGLPVRQGRPQQASTDVDGGGQDVADAARGAGEFQPGQWQDIRDKPPEHGAQGSVAEWGESAWRETQPRLGGMANELPDWLDFARTTITGEFR